MNKDELFKLVKESGLDRHDLDALTNSIAFYAKTKDTESTICNASCPARHLNEAKFQIGVYSPFCKKPKNHEGLHEDGIHLW